MSDKPAFEVVYGTHRYQIWADGRIDGFPPRSVVVNRIPEIVAEAIDDAEQYRSDNECIIEDV